MSVEQLLVPKCFAYKLPRKFEVFQIIGLDGRRRIRLVGKAVARMYEEGLVWIEHLLGESENREEEEQDQEEDVEESHVQDGIEQSVL